MGDLPSTAIGLIGFIVAAAGTLLWRMAKNNSDTVNTFMTYIEKKNGNLERTTLHYTESITSRDKKYEDMLIKHDERHKQMMDDMAARLEATLPIKK